MYVIKLVFERSNNKLYSIILRISYGHTYCSKYSDCEYIKSVKPGDRSISVLRPQTRFLLKHVPTLKNTLIIKIIY